MSSSISRRRFIESSGLALVSAGMAATAGPAAAADDLYHIKMAIGGITWVPYAPVVLAKQLGLFQKHGIDLELFDNTSGSATINAIVSGSADIGCGYFDHTTQLASKGKNVVAFVLMSVTPGIAFFILPGHDDIQKASDLIGHRVAALPGGSTGFLLTYYLRKNGIDPSKVPVIDSGAADTTVAAAKQGIIDAVSTGEPAITAIQNQSAKPVHMLFDTRTAQGSVDLFGSIYPSSTLYAQKSWIDAHPKQIQALTDAIIECLQYIAQHDPKEIVDKMPPEVQGTNKAFYLELFNNMRGIFSTDGKFTDEGVKTAITALGIGIPDVAKANIQPAQLYTNQFVDASKMAAK